MIDSMASGLFDLIRADVVQGLVQASVGWAVLAARAIDPATTEDKTSGRAATAPIRLRATITIDIEARDPAEAEAQTAALQAGIDTLSRAHPTARLTVQRRRPRTRRPASGLVPAPYLDD